MTHEHLPRVGNQKTADALHQDGFAAAVVADYAVYFAFFKFARNIG